jgi:hypothetical protein
MKTIFSVFMFLSAFTAYADVPRYELTTLLGTANDRMPFVQEIVNNHVAIAPGSNFTDYTTGVLYFAWRNGTNLAQTIQVLRESVISWRRCARRWRKKPTPPS